MATVKIPEQKVILCGEFGVGKSSLFRRFMSNSFTESTDRKSTMGLDHFGKKYTVGEKDLKLQLWDTGGMERVASITSSYYKYSEAAILVFALDNPDTFHILSQHLLDIVTYAENAKIFLCGNKFDQKSRIAISDSDMEAFCEQCHNLVSGIYKTSCRTGEGVEEMFSDIAKQLTQVNRSRMELQSIEERSFQVNTSALAEPDTDGGSCSC
ncbi:ras-related protein Rab-2A [Eurytemora carolleeae]|uniref:ras-related protein Rab-2A n=1 Tax=Eurytemora carolleeae TaxID=1294199 RepID=UPI000C761014|nr:ras-related protein Rab-2A [Eurytemora carolleeae]|eukprot:XP_023340959.1 ras-related protein Rab-2A-like [Eurytemora affinis]